MQLRESIEISLHNIRTNKLRSILTLLGIVIGVWSIVGMHSLIGGFQKNLEADLRVLGADVFQVQKFPPMNFGGSDRSKYRNRKDITRRDAAAIREYASLVKSVGEEDWNWGHAVKYRDRRTRNNVVVAGATKEFAPNNGYFLQDGRFITDYDEDHRTSVVVLGMDIVETIFPHQDPVGRRVHALGQYFEVVGVLEEQGERFGQSKDNLIVIPLATYQKILGKRGSINITMQAESPDVYEAAVDQVTGVLRTVRKVAPGKPNDFEVFSSQSLVDTFNDMLRTSKIVLYVIVGVSLLVAGIGIMNIMLVSVTERTREIGIRKSVGAKRRDIMLQFLMEAIVFCETGGIVGIIAGVLTAKFVSMVSPLSAILPIGIMVVALLFSSLVGVVFGVYPAARAARLNAIDALRHE